jgi:tetratricopeptide (TPR) repeat protein
MRYICLFLVVFLSLPIFSQSKVDSVLVVLNREIDNRDFYYKKKESRLKTLKLQIQKIDDENVRYKLYNKLFDEYISYQYDSAYTYASLARNIAKNLGDKALIANADCNLLYCYMSTGLFKEAYDVMKSVNINNSPDNVKARYYELCMRLFSDMSSYNQGTPFDAEYNNMISLYCDSALVYATPGTLDYQQILAFKIRNKVDNEKKIASYLNILNTYKIDSHGKAVIYSTLGRIYIGLNDIDNGIYYMALSAIEDIRSATRETTAKKELASCLFEKGDVMQASKYIQIALEEVTAYNARHRKMEINSILPIVEKQRLHIIEKQKKELSITLFALSLIFVLLLIALFVIYKQISKLKIAKQSIQNQYNEISIVNEKLSESNEIKDQYIFQSLYGKSEYLEKVEALLKKQERKLKAHQFDDLQMLHKEFDIKNERESIFSSFDQAFLKLFPNFLTEYNKFFKAEDHISLDSEGNLTPELRIFALIRLGVSESERVAKFLNLSVNTIYVYKAKVKSKTIVPKEEFEYRIMQIKKDKSGV